MGNDRTFTDEQIKAGREAFYGSPTPTDEIDDSAIVITDDGMGDEGPIARIERELDEGQRVGRFSRIEEADIRALIATLADRDKRIGVMEGAGNALAADIRSGLGYLEAHHHDTSISRERLADWEAALSNNLDGVVS